MPSFDVVSKVDVAELDNAINGIGREVKQRYDFKGSACQIERSGDKVTILADTAEREDEIDLQRAEEALKRAQEDVAATASEMDMERAMAGLRRSQAHLVVARRRRRRSPGSAQPPPSG